MHNTLTQASMDYTLAAINKGDASHPYLTTTALILKTLLTCLNSDTCHSICVFFLLFVCSWSAVLLHKEKIKSFKSLPILNIFMIPTTQSLQLSSVMHFTSTTTEAIEPTQFESGIVTSVPKRGEKAQPWLTSISRTCLSLLAKLIQYSAHKSPIDRAGK